MESRNYTKDKIKYIRLFISYDKTTKDDVYAFVNSKKLLNLLDFFGYTKSSIIEDKYMMGNIGTELDIEPIQTEYADKEYINDVCYNKLYHITTKGNAEKIDKSGIRVRKVNDYREFPERVYLFAVPPKGKFTVRRSEFKDAAVYFTDCDENEDVVIYEVDCSKLTLYKDVASSDSGIDVNCYFAYESIPTKYIRKVWSGTKENLLYGI